MTNYKLTITKLEMAKTMKHFADPIRMYILLEILRLPNITSIKLNKKLYISGTNLFYHLNLLANNNPPLIIESATEKITNHITRRRFKIHPEFIKIAKEFYENLDLNKNTFNLISLYVSNAILHQQIREVKKLGNDEKGSDPKILQKSEFQLSIIDNPVFLMFLDEEYAKELRHGIQEVMNKCSIRYQNLTLTEALRQCTYASIAGIYPMA